MTCASSIVPFIQSKVLVLRGRKVYRDSRCKRAVGEKRQRKHNEVDSREIEGGFTIVLERCMIDGREKCRYLQGGIGRRCTG